MVPVRFKFSKDWRGLDRVRFSSERWYTVTVFENGVCWFITDTGETDGIDFDNFREGGCAIFEGEEHIVSQILIKYTNEV